MKRFIILACIVVILFFAGYAANFRWGFYADLHPNAPVTSFIRTSGKDIYLRRGDSEVPFEIRGVDMGTGIPGKRASDYAIDRETYLRWFDQIQKLGANTIRVYTILNTDFYNAFYEYNKDREEPLYLLHGVWVSDYIQNSGRDAYDGEIYEALIQDCRTLVDILHGKKTLSLGYGMGSRHYRSDISEWVIGYIVGVDWESGLVTYTNQKSRHRNSYTGDYLYTSEDATPFEAMLCGVGDSLIEYESKKYKTQRLVAFSNWPATDPFVYPAPVTLYSMKTACINVEHILQTEQFVSGMFASYHAYPYYPDYLGMMDEAKLYTAEQIDNRLGPEVRKNTEYHISLLQAPEIGEYVTEQDYYDSKGHYNTYLAYLRALNRYHSLPVVITEYGVTTGRGMARQDINSGRNQGNMTEQEQGQALIDCYQDIMDAGCAGSCLFCWQDEWMKRTWNTMHAVDLDSAAYWSDYQTNGQFFGLLTFDPGEEQSVCYVDGNCSEWGPKNLAASWKGMELSVKYDEKFLYFLVKKEGFEAGEDTLYIPIDTTPKTGSTWCRNEDVAFERGCDFLIVIRGRNDSRVMVQKRYSALRSTYSEEFYRENFYADPPDADTPEFERIELPLILSRMLPDHTEPLSSGMKYETGKLRYGNANPQAADFDSLADFIFSGDYVELRIPWQLLNFSDPSGMMIHDDYCEKYGVENLHIDTMYVGIGSRDEKDIRIPMAPVSLEGWGEQVTFNERLKKSYDMLKEYWMSLDEGERLGSEVLLYGYGAVCLSMLAFNIVYNMVMKHSDLRSFRRARKIRTKIRWQLLLLRTGGGVQPKHIRYLKRRLLKLRWLIAFCDGAKELLAKEDAAVAAYDEALQPVIAYLAEAYQKRDDMQAAYFAYVLSKYRKKRHLVMDSVQAVLVGYMKRNSLYCHVNALEALYHFGSAESIVQAVRLLDEGDSFLHGKILTDGLLTYTGDHDTLCRLLWEEFEFLSVRMQVPILNYLRYRTGGFCKEMASLMTDPERDKEIRLCAVRYFGRYPYLPALSPLLDFISDQDPSHWEYAAVSASALSAYPKEQTIGALMEAMHSQNWYVRYNAAASLDTYHPDYPELLNIMEGHDRYAREMLMYRLSSTYQEEEKQREVG